MRHYLNMWKRVFDYKGVSARHEYRAPLLITLTLGVVTAALWCIGSVEFEDGLMIAGIAVGVLFTVHVVPMMALTVRRLRDAGKKPGLAVLSCLAGIGTILVMLVCLYSVSTTGDLPLSNINACVYGPPPFDPNSNINVDVYGPPGDFDPEDNTQAAIYGPPEAFSDSEGTGTDAREETADE